MNTKLSKSFKYLRLFYRYTNFNVAFLKKKMPGL